MGAERSNRRVHNILEQSLMSNSNRKLPFSDLTLQAVFKALLQFIGKEISENDNHARNASKLVSF